MCFKFRVCGEVSVDLLFQKQMQVFKLTNIQPDVFNPYPTPSDDMFTPSDDMSHQKLPPFAVQLRLEKPRRQFKKNCS